MRAQVNLTRIGLYLRYGALVVLGGLTGVLLSRFLSPLVLERGGPFVFVVFAVFLVAVVLIARLLRRVWP
ncbi:MAG TPA: hypothetical protein VHH10_13470 [Rubrobacteraceae bacterium]|nr:hypothetical protein [Rubrobacteraceae bacterium]